MNSVGGAVTLLRETPLVRALHTRIRDKHAKREVFVTASDRLVRLLIEEALGLLPATNVEVVTPCGPYSGVQLPDESSLCAVSILRAADCMLGELRKMMPSAAVGKILIQRDEETALPNLLYAKLPPDIASRPILLLDPMLASGGSAIMAIDVLVERGCKPENIIFVNVVCVKEGEDSPPSV
jgi:uracil phosphoribosyltransferase